MIQDLSTQIDAACRFCNPPEKGRILYEGADFYIMASLGPICEGYLLLVSKKHFDCCGAIPRNISAKFDALYDKIRAVLTNVYGNVVSYEHGRAGSCLKIEGSKHCYHAHMHFIPTEIAMNESVSQEYMPIALENLDGLRKKYADAQSYVFVHDVSMNVYVITGSLESQYLRKIAARQVGNEQAWDWITHQNWELISKGIQRLRPYFKELNKEKHGL